MATETDSLLRMSRSVFDDSGGEEEGQTYNTRIATSSSSMTTSNSSVSISNPLLAPFHPHQHPQQQEHRQRRGETVSVSSQTSETDSFRVFQAVQEAGRHAFGIVAIDVWKFVEGRLVHACLWVDPGFQQRHASEALERIVDAGHPAYAAPVPQVPGAGLAGYFWSLNNNNSNSTINSSSNSSACTTTNTNTNAAKSSPPLIWRHLHAITADPLQPPYPRMKVLEQAGFGKATGIAFCAIAACRGVVVYFARITADERCRHLLNDTTNVEYLRASAQQIGCSLAVSAALRLVQIAKQQRLGELARRVRCKAHSFSALRELHRSVSVRSLRSLPDQRRDDEQDVAAPKKAFQKEPRQGQFKSLLRWTTLGQGIRSHVTTRLRLLWYKSVTTTDLTPPPPVPLDNAVWTFAGVFITLLVLYTLSLVLQHATGTGIVLAPFGALLTLQFSLTAAPASQPRNIVYGQLVSLSLAVLGQIYLAPLLPDVLLVPLIVALAIAVMTRLGIAHPPAAAAVIALFSAPSRCDARTAALIFLGNLVAIILAIAINNLSEKRQYPVYWEFGMTRSNACHLWKSGRWSKRQLRQQTKQVDLHSSTTSLSGSSSLNQHDPYFQNDDNGPILV